MNTKSRIGLAVVAALTTSIGFSAAALAQPRPAGEWHGEWRYEDHPHGDRATTEALIRMEQRREAERRARIHDEVAWEASLDARAAEHRRELEAYWGRHLERAEVRAELSINADRMARLHRILDVAVAEGDVELAARCRIAMNREVNRHARVMARLRME